MTQASKPVVKRNYLGLPKGVRLNGSGYSATLGKDGIRYHLGTYSTAEKAGSVWKEAKTLTHEQLKVRCKPRTLSPYSQPKTKGPPRVVTTPKLGPITVDIPNLNNLWYNNDNTLPDSHCTSAKQLAHYTSRWIKVDNIGKQNRVRV